MKEQSGFQKSDFSGGPEKEVRLLMQSRSPIVRGAAVRLAGKLDMLVVRPELETLLKDAELEVREAAEWALAKIKPNGGRGGEIIRPHGGYAGLKAHKSAEILYDATVAFTKRFIERGSRTRDQMVQAARSGKQNIVEGSAAAGASSKMELKLTAVARASLEELLEDYKDFLRPAVPWPKDDPRAQEIRKMAYIENRSYENYRPYIEKAAPEVAANTCLCLVFQTTFLLDRLIKQLEETFIEKGGFSERMTSARLKRRKEQNENQ